MRFLFRLVVLALAAVGAKTLYDQFAPKAAELRGPAGGVIDSAKNAARDVGQHAKDAAADVRDQASAAANQAQSTLTSNEAPTEPRAGAPTGAPTVASPAAARA
jgi:hypothetical protein